MTKWQTLSIARNWAKYRLRGIYNTIHNIVGEESLSIPDREILASTLPIIRGILTNWDQNYVKKLKDAAKADEKAKKARDEAMENRDK